MFSIIIVDDNRIVSDGIKDLIDWHALNVSVAGIAGNGLEGYNMALELKPDFILVDVDMPIMDGLEMATKVKDVLPETRFIFISCFDDFNYVKEAMDLEAYRYVLKPINFEELTSAIKKLADSKISNLIQEQMEEELKKELKKSIPVLQEQLFKDLIYGKLRDEEDILERMRYLGMESVNKLYLVTFIEIDNYELKYSALPVQQKYMIIEGIKKYVREIVLEEENGYIVNQQHNSLSFILFPKTCSRDAELSKLLDSLSYCKDSINENLGVNVTIGVSEFCDKMTDMAKLLENAEFTVKAKFYSEGNRIILSSEIKSSEDYEEYNLQVIKGELKQIFEQGSKIEVEQFTDKYFNLGFHYPQSYIKSLTFSVINIVQTILIERNQSLGSMFESDISMWEKLAKFETIVDIKQWIINVLETVRTYITNKESNRYTKIVEDIKNIIDTRYAEVNNIEEIVKPLYISGSHSNLIFKQQTGQTIFDYLVSARIEAAKRMLMDPYCKVYEVSEKVGYKNKSYFSSIFKEYTGMTPRQFTDKSKK